LDARRDAFAVLLALACGCDVIQPEPMHDEESRNATLSSGWGCKTCGFTNSPQLGADMMDRFSIDGSAGPDEFELVAIDAPNGTRCTVEVVGSQLRGKKGGTTVVDDALVGWRLVFEIHGHEVKVEIADYEQHPDWVTGTKVHTYALAYDRLPGGTDVPRANVCPGLALDGTSIVMTAGETYDGESYRVEPNRPGWVAMGCRGHVIAKLKLMGYDPNDDYDSSVAQRQAALKMLAADYCGDGSSYTAIGTPLDCEDELGNFEPSWSVGTDHVESAWTDKGATCLTQPRLSSTNPKHICGLGPCDAKPVELIADGAAIVSLVPPTP
jgi:hypothetical protein